MLSALVSKTGLVTNVIVADPATDIAPEGFTLVPLAEGQTVSIGWEWDGKTLRDPREIPVSLEAARATKLAASAALRWEKETGGTTFAGMAIATDAVSQTKYIGAVVGAQIDPNAVINWKTADGTFVTLDAQAITAVAMAVRAHVQACFDREAELKAEIEAASTVEEIAAIDLNTDWP